MSGQLDVLSTGDLFSLEIFLYELPDDLLGEKYKDMLELFLKDPSNCIHREVLIEALQDSDEALQDSDEALQDSDFDKALEAVNKIIGEFGLTISANPSVKDFFHLAYTEYIKEGEEQNNSDKFSRRILEILSNAAKKSYIDTFETSLQENLNGHDLTSREGRKVFSRLFYVLELDEKRIILKKIFGDFIPQGESNIQRDIFYVRMRKNKVDGTHEKFLLMIDKILNNESDNIDYSLIKKSHWDLMTHLWKEKYPSKQ